LAKGTTKGNRGYRGPEVRKEDLYDIDISIEYLHTLMSIDIITYLQYIYNYISIYEYEAIN